MELRKIKCYPSLSEETECFTAELWDDGKHVAMVKNEGRGGSNFFSPMKGFTYEDVRKYDTPDMEEKIFDMVIDYDETSKLQSKGFVLKKGKNIYTVKFPHPITKLKKFGNYSTWLEDKKKQFIKDGYTVLNRNL